MSPGSLYPGWPASVFGLNYYAVAFLFQGQRFLEFLFVYLFVCLVEFFWFFFLFLMQFLHHNGGKQNNFYSDLTGRGEFLMSDEWV